MPYFLRKIVGMERAYMIYIRQFFSAVLLVVSVALNCIWKVLYTFLIPVGVIMAIGIIPVGINKGKNRPDRVLWLYA